MIATIRTLGMCPCPLDTAKKGTMEHLGTNKSRLQFIQKIRRDSKDRRALVTKARDLIYNSGLGIRPTKVEKLLYESLGYRRWYFKKPACSFFSFPISRARSLRS